MTIRLLNFLRETFADTLNLLRSPEGLKSLYGVSLYRNAVYLMLTSGITAVLGFAFQVLQAPFHIAEGGTSAKLETNPPPKAQGWRQIVYQVKGLQVMGGRRGKRIEAEANWLQVSSVRIKESEGYKKRQCGANGLGTTSSYLRKSVIRRKR